MDVGRARRWLRLPRCPALIQHTGAEAGPQGLKSPRATPCHHPRGRTSPTWLQGQAKGCPSPDRPQRQPPNHHLSKTQARSRCPLLRDCISPGPLLKSPLEKIKPCGLQQAMRVSPPSLGLSITIFHTECQIFKGKFPSGSMRIYLRGLPLAVIR